ncbi:eukaryotic aspartyl protease family protein [Striga asiatica]|uniref:Eukaryotic aspartyl protease family protein n=1 Tax=Striga asiatica TaxID=4170 RepID=A0A5A7RBK7_STRAF|nr:eukaryotic aspartyl protease family protein [Striga asiatica]
MLVYKSPPSMNFLIHHLHSLLLKASLTTKLSQNNMSSFITFSTLHFLFLLYIASIFVELHANGSSNSLILSLTHSRSKIRPTRKLDYYDYTSKKTPNGIVPLNELRDGHVMSLSVGSPSQTIDNLVLSTGSDLVWMHCGTLSNHFKCIDCTDSPLCADIHNSDNYDTCTSAGCALRDTVNDKCSKPCPLFSYSYVDGPVAGFLANDTIVLHAKNQPNTRQYISFGCVQSSYRMPLGLIGFGKGPLSLLSQLGFTNNGFAYCFLSFDLSSNPNVSAPLILGHLATSLKEHLQFTRMLLNPISQNLYYIGLESVTVGNKVNIQAPKSLRVFSRSGEGGMLIDSSTSNTHLPDPLYSQLQEAIKSMVKYNRASDVEAKSSFDLCYQKMDDDEAAAAVFGSFQQQNIEVVYDLQNERVGFQTVDCVSYGKQLGL